MFRSFEASNRWAGPDIEMIRIPPLETVQFHASGASSYQRELAKCARPEAACCGDRLGSDASAARFPRGRRVVHVDDLVDLEGAEDRAIQTFLSALGTLIGLNPKVASDDRISSGLS